MEGKQKRAAQSLETEIFVGQIVNMRVRPANSGEDPLTVANNYRAGNINLCGKITRRKSGWCTRVYHVVGLACTRCIDVALHDVAFCCLAGETVKFLAVVIRRKRMVFVCVSLTLTEITTLTYRVFHFHRKPMNPRVS